MLALPALAALTVLLAVPATAQIPYSAVADSSTLAPPPDARLTYGSAPDQFAELRLPRGAGPHPIVMLIHGGCWRAQYSAAHVAAAAEALRQAGFATWVVEYRRVGNDGGGEPGTFDDIRAAYAVLQSAGGVRGLDLSRIALMGHSAGGQLALWLGAEPNVRVRAVIGLAAITDLAAFAQPAGCGSAVSQLLGGTADERAAVYAARAPVTRTAVAAPVHLFVAREDRVVPRTQQEAFSARFPATVVHEVTGGHFDLVAPWSDAWRAVLAAVRASLR